MHDFTDIIRWRRQVALTHFLCHTFVDNVPLFVDVMQECFFKRALHSHKPLNRCHMFACLPPDRHGFASLLVVFQNFPTLCSDMSTVLGWLVSAPTIPGCPSRDTDLVRTTRSACVEPGFLAQPALIHGVSCISSTKISRWTAWSSSGFFSLLPPMTELTDDEAKRSLVYLQISFRSLVVDLGDDFLVCDH